MRVSSLITSGDYIAIAKNLRESNRLDKGLLQTTATVALTQLHVFYHLQVKTKKKNQELQAQTTFTQLLSAPPDILNSSANQCVSPVFNPGMRSPVSDDTAQNSAVISWASCRASCSICANWAGDCRGNTEKMTSPRCSFISTVKRPDWYKPWHE